MDVAETACLIDYLQDPLAWVWEKVHKIVGKSTFVSPLQKKHDIDLTNKDITNELSKSMTEISRGYHTDRFSSLWTEQERREM